MTDIVCRCGEPWDCTGGLHCTHTDMPWWKFENFIHGLGCPICEGDFKPTKANDVRWMQSLRAATDELEPYKDFPILWVPERGWEWHDTEPSLLQVLEKRNPEHAAKLKGFIARARKLSGLNSDVLVFDNTEGLEGFDVKEHHEGQTGWWVIIGRGILDINDDDPGPVTSFAKLNLVCSSRVFAFGEHGVALRLGVVKSDGTLFTHPTIDETVEDVLSLFEGAENPRVLDPEAFEAELEKRREAKRAEHIDEAREAIAELTGLDVEIISDDYAATFLVERGDAFELLTRTEMFERLVEVITPVGWNFYRSVTNSAVVLAVPGGMPQPYDIPPLYEVCGVVFGAGYPGEWVPGEETQGLRAGEFYFADSGKIKTFKVAWGQLSIPERRLFYTFITDRED